MAIKSNVTDINTVIFCAYADPESFVRGVQLNSENVF